MTRQRRRFAAGLLAACMVCTLAFVTRQTGQAEDTALRAVPVLQTVPSGVNTLKGETYHTENTHLLHHFGAEGSGAAEADLYQNTTNNYAKDGGDSDPRYALVTTDPARAEKDGGSTLLSYEDPDHPGSNREYPVSVRYIDITKPGSKALLTDFEDLKGENTTIFLEGGPFYADDSDNDPGTRNETSRFFDFYDNFSVVGINTDSNVTIYSQPLKELGSADKGYIQGYQVGNAQNVCLQNLTFDARNFNMAQQSDGEDHPDDEKRDGKYPLIFFRVSSMTTTGKGEHSSVDGFIMKNVAIQNLGNADAPQGDLEYTQSGNMALHVSHGRSQMNFEQLVFRNVLPSEDGSVLVLNQVSNTNFRDVTFEDCAPGTAYIDYDSTSGETEYVPVKGMGAVFAGKLAVVKNGEAVTDQEPVIRCHTLEAGRLLLPDSVRYATAGTEFYAYQQPPAGETTLYDIHEGSFMIRPGETGALDTHQLQAVLKDLHEKRGLNAAVAVKLAANEQGEIPAIEKLGDLWPSPNVEVTMVAVKDPADPYESDALVPVTEDFTVTVDTAGSGGQEENFTGPVSGRLRFYNLDFARNAGYTLQEAAAGIDPDVVTPSDPLDGTYYEDALNYREHSPEKATKPAVLDIGPETFQNCRFTVLNKTFTTNAISLPSWNPGKNALVVETGSSAAVTPTFTGFSGGEEETEQLSAVDFTALGGDADIYWESSDASVASVFYENGVLQVTGVSEGSAAIFGKARDRNNQGEIEKPYTTFSVEVAKKDVLATEQYTVTYHANGGEGSLKALNNPYTAGVSVTLLAPEDKITARNGERFMGWNTRPDGGGELYQPGDGIIINAHVELYAIWQPTETEEPQPPAVTIELNYDDHYAYLTGYPDGTIRPEGHVSREDAASIFYRLLSEGTREGMRRDESGFTDVEGGRWSETAIATLSGMGIITGYDNGTFQPEKTITRAEFAAFASRLDKQQLQDLPELADTKDHWAENEIGRVVSLGWISADADGRFRPDDDITRAEMAGAVNRMLKRGVSSEDALSDDVHQWPDNMDTEKWYYYDLLEASYSHNYEWTGDDGLTEIWTGLREDPAWEE